MKGKKGSGGGRELKNRLGNGIAGLEAATYSGSAGPNYTGGKKRGGSVHGGKSKPRLDRAKGGGAGSPYSGSFRKGGCCK